MFAAASDAGPEKEEVKVMRTLYFFVGTQAELMKLFAVINEARAQGFECRIISTGQNSLQGFSYLQKAHAQVDIDIQTHTDKQKNTLGYLGWFVSTARNGKNELKQYFTPRRRRDALCVVHGDTLTTTMGAWICKTLKLPYVHIESGLRSFNFFSPFPEEFDRLYGSLYSEMNFCPGKVHADYARHRFKGQAVDTVYNTNIETLYDALAEIGETRHQQQPGVPYFMFMLHRQENIMNKRFVCAVVQRIVDMSKKMPCVFIYHSQTRAKMERFGVFDALVDAPKITLLPRQSYLDFIRLVCAAEFIVTDGCGNQQEFYYLGKPSLILRSTVERNTEGLGWNAKLFNNDFDAIPRFLTEYHDYKKERITIEASPSKIIVNNIKQWFDENAAQA